MIGVTNQILNLTFVKKCNQCDTGLPVGKPI